MPFAGYKDFDDCVKQNQDKNDPDAYCAVIKRKVEDSKMEKENAIIKTDVTDDGKVKDTEVQTEAVDNITAGSYKTKGGETIVVHSVSGNKATISGDDAKQKEIDLDALKGIVTKKESAHKEGFKDKSEVLKAAQTMRKAGKSFNDVEDFVSSQIKDVDEIDGIMSQIKESLINIVTSTEFNKHTHTIQQGDEFSSTDHDHKHQINWNDGVLMQGNLTHSHSFDMSVFKEAIVKSDDPAQQDLWRSLDVSDARTSRLQNGDNVGETFEEADDDSKPLNEAVNTGALERDMNDYFGDEFGGFDRAKAAYKKDKTKFIKQATKDTIKGATEDEVGDVLFSLFREAVGKLVVGDEVETMAGAGKVLQVSGKDILVKLNPKSDFPGQTFEYREEDLQKI